MIDSTESATDTPNIVPEWVEQHVDLEDVGIGEESVGDGWPCVTPDKGHEETEAY